MKKNLPLKPQLLGKQGEDIAASYLSTNGYTLIERNFRIRYGELDIVAIHNQTLVFIEVKIRTGQAFGLPEEAITPKKLKEIIKTAQFYRLNHNKLPELERIDVIAIKIDHNGKVSNLNHIQNITE